MRPGECTEQIGILVGRARNQRRIAKHDISGNNNIIEEAIFVGRRFNAISIQQTTKGEVFKLKNTRARETYIE